jgi:hypothetical protein
MCSLPSPTPVDLQMPELEPPDHQLQLNPTTNTSANTPKSPSPSNAKPNPSSAARLWERLRSAIHNGICHQKEALSRRLSDFRDYVQHPILPPDSRPNATTMLSFLCILISFVILLCVGAKLPVKAMWIIILALGGTCSIVLPIRYFMSRQANRMFLLFLCSVYSIINQYIGGHIYRANLGTLLL